MTESEFSIQVQPHAKALQAYALKFTRDVEDANDLMQDTLMKALRFYDNFQQGSNLKAWLFTIMRNTFINDYRKRSRTQSVISQEEELTSSQLVGSASGNSAVSSFAIGDINKALGNLTDAYRIPFVRYVEGYKYEEIAKELSIPLGTVKTRIHQAREMLKKQLPMYLNQRAD